MELKLSQMTSLAMLTENESSLEDKPRKTKLVPIGIILITLSLIAASAVTLFSLNEKYNALFDPLASTVDTDVLIYQVPGGMLSNLVSQLKQQDAIDKYDDEALTKEINEDMSDVPINSSSASTKATYLPEVYDKPTFRATPGPMLS